jgi:hypothetical protein
MTLFKRHLGAAIAPVALALFVVGSAGCDNKETILDADTPAGSVEIERDRDTGAIDVDATDDDKVIDVDTPGADVEVTRDDDTGSVDVDAD